MSDIQAVADAITSDTAQIQLSLPMDLAWAVLVSIQDAATSGTISGPMLDLMVDFAWNLQAQIEVRHPEAAAVLATGWEYDTYTEIG